MAAFDTAATVPFAGCRVWVVEPILVVVLHMAQAEVDAVAEAVGLEMTAKLAVMVVAVAAVAEGLLQAAQDHNYWNIDVVAVVVVVVAVVAE